GRGGTRRGAAVRGGRAGVRGARGGAAAGADSRRGGQPAPRAGGQIRPGRAVRLTDPWPGERAADRAELLLGGPEGDTVPQRVGRGRRARRVAGGAAPGRHRVV